MPRGKGRRKKKEEKVELDVDLNEEEKNKNKPKKVDEGIQDIEESLLNLNEMNEFLKVKHKSIGVCYIFNTMDLGIKDVAIKIQNKMTKTLQDAAKAKKMHINANKIHWKTYPRGVKTFVKAWFHLYDATGRGAPEVERKQTMPREGLWIEEPEKVIG